MTRGAVIVGGHQRRKMLPRHLSADKPRQRKHCRVGLLFLPLGDPNIVLAVPLVVNRHSVFCHCDPRFRSAESGMKPRDRASGKGQNRSVVPWRAKTWLGRFCQARLRASGVAGCVRLRAMLQKVGQGRHPHGVALADSAGSTKPAFSKSLPGSTAAVPQKPVKAASTTSGP